VKGFIPKPQLVVKITMMAKNTTEGVKYTYIVGGTFVPAEGWL